jgi:hypothetical protein
MEAILGSDHEINVGEPVVLEAPNPVGDRGVVFEDDGATGYFYALDFGLDESPIVDAVHIYSVECVTDRDRPSRVQILWSADQSKAALLINRVPHAVFDFVAKRGYCRDEFPPPAPGSAWTRHGWNDALRGDFI